MLETAKGWGFNSVVSWLSGEYSFKVHAPNIFVTQVMSRLFNQTKSFQRQLNMWGFGRNCCDPQEIADRKQTYYVQGQRLRCCHMRRVKVKKDRNGKGSTSTKKAKSATTSLRRSSSPIDLLDKAETKRWPRGRFCCSSLMYGDHKRKWTWVFALLVRMRRPRHRRHCYQAWIP
jgi:hypothetical protein